MQILGNLYLNDLMRKSESRELFQSFSNGQFSYIFKGLARAVGYGITLFLNENFTENTCLVFLLIRPLKNLSFY